MPVLRLNAEPRGLTVHGSPANPHAALMHAARGDGPIIVMVHGFKYQPGHRRHCPHRSLFAGEAAGPRGWLAPLGFGIGAAEEGLALAFGWPARGLLWEVHNRARRAGALLAEAIGLLRRAAPHRPVHIVSHSMGSEVALEALHHLPAGSITRMIVLNGASYRSRAAAALQRPAGRAAEMLNITSGENDLFDFAFERLIAPPAPGDRALGAGLEALNAVTIQIDCAAALAALGRISGPIAPPCRRVCHWSAYTRPGVLDFYRTALREPGRASLPLLRHVLPAERADRFARLLAPLPRRRALPYLARGAS